MPGQQKRTKESRLVWRLTGGGKESLPTLKKKETGMRLDYLFCSRPVQVAESRVICSGKGEPVVSDHYGVIIETENGEDGE